jgi:zinc protease
MVARLATVGILRTVPTAQHDTSARAAPWRATHAALVALVLPVLVACGSGARSPGGAAGDGFNINIALPVEELDLPNGLHVVLHPERSASSALVYVRYYVGSKDDPQGRSGFAHFFEHLMFRGSKNTAGKDYEQWFEDIGAVTNAGTSLDYTDYHAEVPPGALARAIWLEADRMAFPLATLDEEAFGHERDVVKNELREHYEDVPLGNLRAIAHASVYGAEHPYGTMTIGRGEELDKTTLAEAHAFASRYYRPNNATLVVCGQFDTAAAKALVTRYFATIPAGSVPLSRFARPPAMVQERHVTVQADVDGPALAIAWPAPATHQDGSDELDFGLTFFAGRLRRRLVTEKKIANSVSVGYEHARLGGLVMITVKLKPGASPGTAISVVDEYLTEASRLGRLYPWDNFGSFKTSALVGEVGSLESLEGRALRILHDLELHGAVNAVQLDLRRLQSVRAADVGAAIEHFLIDPPRVVIEVTPTAGAPRAGRAEPL